MVGACQQNSGIFLVRGGGLGQEICGGRQRTRSETKLRVYCCEKQDGAGGGAGDQITWAGRELGADGDRTRYRRGPRLSRQGARSGQGPDGMPARAEAWARAKCRRKNQLKRKRSIISSSNPGFSKSFSLVIIKLLCSKNPASW